MRFLRRRGFDHDCLPAALLSLAVKGRVVIADGPGDGFTVERRAQAARTVAPSPDEAALLASLFDEGRHRFEVPTTRSVAAERMVARHRRLFDDAALRRHVRLNTGWWGGGVAFLAAWGLGMALLIPALVFIVVVAFGALILGGIAVAGLGVAVQRVWDGGLGALGETVFSRLAGLAFGAVSAGLMVFVGVEGDWRGLVLVAAGVALAAVFHWLLPALTPEGRAAMDEIEGTLRYLTVAEAERRGSTAPPDRRRISSRRFCPVPLRWMSRPPGRAASPGCWRRRPRRAARPRITPTDTGATASAARASACCAAR